MKDHYAYAIGKLRHYGLQTWAAFTIGHDTDTLKSIEATYEFAKKSKEFDFVSYINNSPFMKALEKIDNIVYGDNWSIIKFKK